MKTPLPILIGSLAFGGFGLLIVYFAFNNIIDNWRFMEGASSATGIVEDISTQYSEMGSGSSKTRNWTEVALIQFSLADGAVIEFEHAYGLVEGVLEEGQNVEVAYHPEAPQEARVNSFPALWAGDIVLFVFGSVFMGLGFVVYSVIGKA